MYLEQKKDSAKPLMMVAQHGWEKITFAADTDAFDHIVPEEELPGYEVRDSRMSKTGEAYVGAGGEEIENVGQTEIEGYLNDGKRLR